MTDQRIFDTDREVWVTKRDGEDDETALYRARYGRLPREPRAAHSSQGNPWAIALWIVAIVGLATGVFIAVGASTLELVTNDQIGMASLTPFLLILLFIITGVVSLVGALALHGTRWLSDHSES